MISRTTNLALSSPMRVPAPLREPPETAQQGRNNGQILFALSGRGRPTESLHRAVAFCDALRAELHVLRVLPERANLSVLDAPQAVERKLTALRATQSWLEDAEISRFADSPVEVRSGSFVEEVAFRAAEMGATLIVLPPRIGATATTLARVSCLPVLVARRPKSHRGILVATDLEDPHYPVLQLAEAIALQLDAAVVALHNVSQIPLSFGLGLPWPTMDLDEEVMNIRQSKLVRATAHWQIENRFVLACEPNPVDAILSEATSRNADLVIVGTRPRSWLERFISGSIAEQIVAKAQRSVLVTPIGPCS